MSVYTLYRLIQCISRLNFRTIVLKSSSTMFLPLLFTSGYDPHFDTWCHRHTNNSTKKLRKMVGYILYIFNRKLAKYIIEIRTNTVITERNMSAALFNLKVKEQKKKKTVAQVTWFSETYNHKNL